MSQSSTDHYRNTLRYQGQDYRFTPTYLRTRDPIAPTNTSPDIKPPEQQGYYPVSSLWTNTTNDRVWLLAGIHNNLANWVLISSGGGVSTFIHTPDGNDVFPVAGQINFTSPNITITGAGNTVNFDAAPVLDTLDFNLPNGPFVDVFPAGGVVKLRSSNASVTISGTAADTIDLISAAGTATFIHTPDGNDVFPIVGEIDFASANIDITGAGNTVTFDASPVLDDLTFDLLNGAFPNVSPAAGIVKVRSSDASVTISGTAADTIDLVVAGGGGGSANSFPTDVGTATPVAGVLNILGVGPFQSVTSAPGISNTVKIKAPNCALFIVDTNADYGTHTTIQSAINAAALQQAITGVNQTIFIRPGTYTENPIMAPGVSLTAFTSDSESPNVSIVGKILINTAGPVSVAGIRCITNGDYAIAVTTTAANPQVTFTDCTIIAANFNAILVSVNCTLTISFSDGDILDGVSAYCTLNAGTTQFTFCRMFNTSASSGVSIATNANFNMAHCNWNNRIQTLPGSSHGAIFTSFRMGGLAGPIIQIHGVLVNQYRWTYCSVDAGNQSAIDVNATSHIELTNVNIDCFGANAITGAGSIAYTLLQFSGLTSTCSVATQTPGFVGPRIALAGGGCQIISGAGSPNGLITAPKGSLWLRTDGSATNNRSYINTNSATAWTAIITAT